MVLNTLRNLRELLDRAGQRLAVLSGISVLTGLLEAFVLVVVVRVAVGMAAGDSSISVASVTLSSRTWLVLAALSLVPSAVLHLTFARLAATLSADVLERARQRIAVGFIRASFDRQTRESEGALQHASTTLAEQSSYLAFLIVIGGTSVLNLCILMLFALVVSWQATLVILITGSALFALLHPLAKRTQGAAQSFVATNTRYAESIAQQTAISLETRTLGVEDQRAALLTQRARAASEALRRSRFDGLTGSFVYRDVSLAILLVLLSVAFSRTSSDIIDIGPAILLVVRSLSYAQGVQNARQVLSEHGENLQALVTYIGDLEGAEWHQGDQSLRSTPETITFTEVSYRYPEAATDAVRSVNLTIRAQEAIGLIGPSGGGKSTLVQLLLGLRRPTSGVITIGDTDLALLDSVALSKWMAVVPQDVNLISGTVLDNVRFFRDDVSDADALHALARAHILDEAEAMPDGVHTTLGPRGLGLSGGQRQRVGIARALAGQASLIVLDEPTSALDSVSELRIRETLEDLKRSVTLVVVAHRPATLEICDRVLQLSDGLIADDGPERTGTT